MKLTKGELKTWNSQQSQIDMFSKLQNSFLQKFFRLNLIDYFEEYVTNMYEYHPSKKTLTKNHKTLLNYFFKVQQPFTINEFEHKIHSFYKHRSKSFQNGDLQHIFKIRYCNWNPVPNLFKKGQLIFIDVKIKAQISRLQTIPLRLIQTLELSCRSFNQQPKDQQFLKQTLKNYINQYVNIFIVYFGDINFHIVPKKNYQQQSITLYGKSYKLRIFTFFISKQALLETFRSINKVSNLDHINDLAIQFYQLKRQKRRLKQSTKKDHSQKLERSQKEKMDKLFLIRIDQKLKEITKYYKLILGGLGVTGLIYLFKQKWS